MEAYARGMEQRSNYAALRGVQIRQELEESGGVCIRHGAQVKRKLCSSEGRTNQAQRGGVCIRHGAKSNSAAVKDVLNEGC
eukprot:scaffold14090_cov83-Skeletonema_dohrnii-CCMP3373.AAC.3